MGRGVGVSPVEPKGGGWLGGAGAAVVDQRVGASVEVLAVDALCQTRPGGGPRQGLRGGQGRPRHAERKHWVVPKTIGSMAVRIPGSDLIDTLGQEGMERGGDRGGRPLVLYSRGKACGEANLTVDATQQEGTKVGRQGPAFAISPDGIASDRRKTQLFWGRMQQKHTSCGFYGMDGSHFPFYQRLTRGVCFFVKNPG
jgi:hypothetical protein